MGDFGYIFGLWLFFIFALGCIIGHAVGFKNGKEAQRLLTKWEDRLNTFEKRGAKMPGKKLVGELMIHYICDGRKKCSEDDMCQKECILTAERTHAKNPEVVDACYEFMAAYEKLRKRCDINIYEKIDGAAIEIVEKEVKDDKRGKV